MSDGSIRIQTAIDNSGAKEDLKELADLVDQYADKMDDKASIDIQKMCSEYQKLVEQQSQLNKKTDLYKAKLQEINSSLGTNPDDVKLNNQYIKTTQELEKIKTNAYQIESRLEVLKTKSQYFVKTWKNANVEIINTSTPIGKIKTLIDSLTSKLFGCSKQVSSIKNGFEKTHKSIGSGIKKLSKYALALFSIRSIYTGLSRLANKFLESGTEQANQLKANIDYMTSALSTLVSPALDYLVNAAMKLMSIFNGVLKALFGIDMFANATAASLSEANKSAKEISKLKTSFDEMETLGSSSNDTSSGGTSVAPNFDFGQYESMMDKFEHFFDPILKAWDSTGHLLVENIEYSFENLKYLFVSIGKSFDKIWQNGSGQELIENLILLSSNLVGLIGDIAKGWGDAWNEAGVGDRVIQKMLDITNKLLVIVNKVVEKFSEWIRKIDWSPVLEGLDDLLDGIDLLLDCIMNGDWDRLGTFLYDKITGYVKTMIEWIENIDWYQLGKDAANFVFSAVSKVLTELIKFITSIDWLQLFFDIAEMCVKGFINGLTFLVSFVVELFDEVVNAIKDLLGIHSPSTVFKDIGLMILEGLKKGLSLSAIKKFFITILETIKETFNSIPSWFKSKFTEAWNNVKNVFSSGGKIFDGIKDGISSVFKTVVNKLIDGINKVIAIPFNKINKMLNTIRDISVLGITPFKSLWTYNPLTVPQIPKLAKGGIVNRATQVVVGEAGKEAVLPLENNTEWMEQLAELINSSNNGEQVINLYVDGERLFKWFVKTKKQKEFVMNGG